VRFGRASGTPSIQRLAAVVEAGHGRDSSLRETGSRGGGRDLGERRPQAAIEDPARAHGQTRLGALSALEAALEPLDLPGGIEDHLACP